MHFRTYLVRDGIDANKFFGQPAVIRSVQLKPFQDADDKPWRYSQDICTVGGVEHIVITIGSAVNITALGHVSDQDLAVIAHHVEFAGGRLFDGRCRVHGIKKSNGESHV